MGQLLYQVTMTYKNQQGNQVALALSINGNANPIVSSQLILNSLNSKDPDQLWTWLFDPQIGTNILFNPGRNLFAGCAI